MEKSVKQSSDNVAGQQPERRPRGRPKKTSDEAQREALADAAWPLFLERGFQRTTMSDVAKKAHVSLRTLYQLFPSKLGLFVAVVEAHRQTMIALPGDYDEIPVKQALMKIFCVDIAPEAQQRRMTVMAMFLEESRNFPELGAILEEYGPQQARKLLASWIERQITLGRMNVAEPAMAAHMLMDVAFGAMSLKFNNALALPGASERREYLLACFDMLINGIGPRPAD